MKRIACRWLVSLAALVALSACDSAGNSSALAAKVDELEKKVSKISDDVNTASLDAVVAKSMAETKADTHPTAVFDPTDSSFSLLDASVVTLAVSVNDVRPMADGSRITFHFGNPSSAIINDLTLTITYGARQPSGAAAVAWAKGLLTVEKKIGSPIRPGSWNPQQVTLPGVPPAQLGYVSVTASASNISLARQ